MCVGKHRSPGHTAASLIPRPLRIIKRLTWRQHFVLNLLFVGLAIAGIILQTQYYFSGGIYLSAGAEGVNYTCVSGSGTRTYYTNDGITFLPCQPGA